MSFSATIDPALLSMSKRASKQLVPFRMRRVGNTNVLSNDFGDHIFLEAAELERLMTGGIETDDPLWARLKARNFLIDELDRPALVTRAKNKLQFLGYGPNLHILVVTLRCNHSCTYCHASRAPMAASDTDMSIETAERSVDFAFESTSPGLTIEFQGGEPMVNWPVVKHVIDYALQKNALAGKDLTFALVTNLSLMDDEKLDYLLERRVQICTSLDGPEDLHNNIRLYKDGNSYQQTVYWMKRINERYGELGLDQRLYKVEALPTVTRKSLGRSKELLSEYVDAGCQSIFLRHLDPFGFAAKTKRELGYTMSEFLEFYENALDQVLELNRQGTDFVERTAAVFLARILGHLEPNFLDIRNPCGAGIGQLAYNYDGRIFTCDEGRMVDAGGNSCFSLGHVSETGYQEAMSSPTVRAMSIASTLQAQPGCDNCVYQPWCGICPVHNFVEQGSIQGRMADSTWCQKHMGILDLLMKKLHEADPHVLEVFERWAQVREQPHFLHRNDEAL